MGPLVEVLDPMVPLVASLASMEEVSLASFVAVSDLGECGLGRVLPYRALDRVGDRDDRQLLASDGQHENVLVHVLPCHALGHVGDHDDLLEVQILSAH